jgi:hypothetical protein
MLEMNKNEKHIYLQFYNNVFLPNTKLNYVFISRYKDHLWIKNINGFKIKQSYPFNLKASWELNLVNVDVLKDNKEQIMSKLMLNDIKESDIVQIYKDIFETVLKLPIGKYQSFDYTLTDESIAPPSIQGDNYLKRGIFLYKRI